MGRRSARASVALAAIIALSLVPTLTAYADGAVHWTFDYLHLSGYPPPTTEVHISGDDALVVSRSGRQLASCYEITH